MVDKVLLSFDFPITKNANIYFIKANTRRLQPCRFHPPSILWVKDRCVPGFD